MGTIKLQTVKTAGKKSVSFTLNGSGDMTVSWGDQARSGSGEVPVSGSSASHEYAAPGTYNIVIRGSEITKLWCVEDDLVSLDLSQNSELTVLYCQNNNLKSLNVGNLNRLEELGCNNNSLTELTVGGKSTLKSFNCSANALTTLDVSGFTALKSLTCHTNHLKKLGIGGCKALEVLSCYKNELDNLNPTSIRRPIEAQIQTGRAAAALDRAPLDKNATVLASELSSISDMNEFVNMKHLYCHSNQLKGLSIAKCVLMETVYCGDNLLKNLVTDHLPKLTRLSCRTNQLENIDLSGCSSLKTVYCYDNPLVCLTVTGCASLDNIYVSYVPEEEMNEETSGTLTLKQFELGREPNVTDIRRK